MPATPCCAHCFHRYRGPLHDRIVGPARTLLRYHCCRCGEQAHLGYSINDRDEAEVDAPAAGHFHAASHGGGCAHCPDCRGSES